MRGCSAKPRTDTVYKKYKTLTARPNLHIFYETKSFSHLSNVLYVIHFEKEIYSNIFACDVYIM